MGHERLKEVIENGVRRDGERRERSRMERKGMRKLRLELETVL